MKPASKRPDEAPRLVPVPFSLSAGAATADLTPSGSVFLYGYPHVRRYSTGVHDRLRCTALYLQAGGNHALFLANDLIVVEKHLVTWVRQRITAETGLPAEAIMITATHTHSGPLMADGLSHASDPILPKTDKNYVRWVGERMVEAACAAVRAAVPAELGLAVAKAEGVGTNRHDPAGPADPEVPVLVVRALKDQAPLACMFVYAMHPTVLHEDSTLISGDFQHFARQFLQREVLGGSCPVLCHIGTAGDQSPRHVTRANTFAEAQRLGEKLGRSMADVIPRISYRHEAKIRCHRDFLDLQTRDFPTQVEAEESEKQALARFTHLRQTSASRQEVRTAECDWFGAEETAELARAAADGRLRAAVAGCMPMEIQVIEVGPWKFVAWPGEHFVDYGLALRARSPDTFVITLANGTLEGYLVTAQAVAGKFYEATNAVFDHSNGPRIVQATLALLGAEK